jgi:hypothetical protein
LQQISGKTLEPCELTPVIWNEFRVLGMEFLYLKAKIKK